MMLRKIWNWHYWMRHIIISFGIIAVAVLLERAGVSLALLSGALFYLAHEITDRMTKGYWDWKGMAPVPIGIALAIAAWYGWVSL